MNKKESMSLRLPQETKTKLELLARSTGRTKSVIALEAIERFCDAESWQIQAIQEGLKQAKWLKKAL